MKKSYLLLLVLLFSCQNENFNKLEDLSIEYMTKGRSDSIKNEMTVLLAKCDSLYKDDVEYLKLKLHVYTVLDDSESRRKIVAEISNTNLNLAPDLFNRASDLIHAGKDEGVVELIIKLSNENEWLFELLLHDTFAILISDKRFDSLKTNNYKILKELRKTDNTKIVEETIGLNTWVSAIQASSGDEILEIVQYNQWGDNIRDLRYQFLVANLLVEYTGYEVYADSLVSSVLQKSYDELKNISPNPTERKEIEKRALLRYYIAYGSFQKYKYLSRNNKSDELSNSIQQARKKYLSIASDFSSDQKDIKAKHAYFYDMHILKGKEEYRTEYLEFLKEQNLFEESLDEAIKIIINDPDKIKEATQIIKYVDENFPETNRKTSFKKYLETKFEMSLPKAIDFTLNTLDEKQISISSYKGRWILLDFWGTWCSPCRDELPKLNSFYLEYCKSDSSEIKLITLAQDKKENVEKFIKINNYNFPIVILNNEIKENYSVIGFPTKVLISPSGYYFNIPYQSDYLELITDYMNLLK